MTNKRSQRVGDSVEYILNENSPFTIQEAFKALRTNITFSLPGVTNYCIGFTSSNRSEGKSTSAINLAISYAQLGKKVILVDCDLRLPTVAAKLGIKGTPGFSDILVGEAKFAEAAKRVTKYGIDVLPAGNIPPDATKLLASKQAHTIIEGLKKYYDVILIDFPPVTTVADALLMKDVIDGYLLLVRNEYSDMRSVDAMMDQMKMAEANVLGFVYTHAPVTQKKYYAYYKK